MKTKKSKKAKSIVAREQTIDEVIKQLVTFPFPCPNCDKLLTEAKLYCSEVCRQEAKFVRYVRSCRSDGRSFQEDVQEAIRIRLAMILSGGYPEQERRIPDLIRQAVIARDKGRCQSCGNPGDQIDHMHSNSAELDNLQLLCDVCHRHKTMASFITVTAESHPEAWLKAEALRLRTEAPEALRLCDAEEWAALWHRIASERRQIRKQRLCLEAAAQQAHPADAAVRPQDQVDFESENQPDHLPI